MPARHGAFDGDVVRHVDDDRGRQPLARVLAEQREVEDDDAIGARVRVDLRLDLGLHRGMHDAVEVVERLLVAEHDRGHGRTVERAVLVDDVGAEAVGHRIEQRRSRRLQIAGDLVGVDDRRAPLGEHRRHRRLSRSDSSGQSHDDHENEYCPTPQSRAAFSSSR